MSRIAELASAAEAVLFDFDGPLCDVFAGLPADQVADELAHLVQRETGEWIGADTADPLEILLRSARFGDEVVRRVEDELIRAELLAVSTSEAEPGGLDALGVSVDTGRRVAVVSNNSPQAVAAFLERHESASAVSLVIGRAYADPRRMKPNPSPLRSALAGVERAPERALMVGDSLTDVEVCAAVGVPCVAFANKPGKRELFSAAPAVIDGMRELADALRTPLATGNVGTSQGPRTQR